MKVSTINNINFNGQFKNSALLQKSIRYATNDDEAPIIQKLVAQGTPIISEIEFAGRYTNAKMICITGSNGKTTTTSLIYHIFKSNFITFYPTKTCRENVIICKIIILF